MQRLVLSALVMVLAVPAGAQERSESDSTDSPRVSGLIGSFGAFFGARNARASAMASLPEGWGCNGSCLGLNRKLMAPPFGGTPSGLSSFDDLSDDLMRGSSSLRSNAGGGIDEHMLPTPASAETKASEMAPPFTDSPTDQERAAFNRASSRAENASASESQGEVASSNSAANGGVPQSVDPWSTDFLAGATGAPSGSGSPTWSSGSSSFASLAEAGFSDFAEVSEVVPAAAVVAPEPGSVALVAVGLLSLAAIRRRRTRM